MGHSVGMCSRRFRLLLAVCLAWALPLQGLAAARMLWCHVLQMQMQMQDAANAALPAAVPLLPGRAPAHEAVTTRPGAQAPTFLTGGPERPPRTPYA